LHRKPCSKPNGHIFPIIGDAVWRMRFQNNENKTSTRPAIKASELFALPADKMIHEPRAEVCKQAENNFNFKNISRLEINCCGAAECR
jgi:hypothetical protein